MIKEIIGTTTLIGLNNLGLILALNNQGLLYYIGLTDYFLTGFMTFFVVYHYMRSDFYRSLKYPWENKEGSSK